MVRGEPMNSSESDGDDPWSGDSIPASAGLGELRWAAANGPGAGGGVGGDAVADRGSHDSSATRSGLDGQRRQRLTIGAVAAVVVIGGGVLAWSSAASNDGDTQTSSATLAEFPDDTPPADSAPDVSSPASTVDPATVVDEPPRELLGDDGMLDSDQPESELGELVVVTAVDLPESVAAITEPTEIVGVTSDGRLLTLGVPSGTVQMLDVVDDPNPAQSGAQVVAAPSFTLVSTGGRSPSMSVVDPSGTVTPVDLDGLGDGSTSFNLSRQGWIRRADGTDAAIVLSSPTVSAVHGCTSSIEPAPSGRSGKGSTLGRASQ